MAGWRVGLDGYSWGLDGMFLGQTTKKTEKGKDGLLTNNLWMVFSGAMLVPVGLTLCDFWGQDAIL